MAIKKLLIVMAVTKLMPLSISSFARILKKAGAERVSDEAAIELRDAVQEIANELARDAATLCRHANRRTVMKHDVEFVFRKRHQEHGHA